MNKVKRSQLREYFYRFYVEEFALLDAGDYDGVFDHYYRTARELPKSVPLHIYGDRELRGDTNYVVIANHVATPNLLLMHDVDRIKSLGLNPEKLLFAGLTPFPFRHYPIVNFLSRFDFFTHSVSYGSVRRLDKLRRLWGSIVIDKRSTNKMRIIADFIDDLPTSNHAVLFFPEGKDSAYTLDKYHTLWPFKTGFVKTARIFKLPILPISLTFDRVGYEYHMYVHQPITFQDYEAEDLQKFADRMRELIIDGMLRTQKVFKND